MMQTKDVHEKFFEIYQMEHPFKDTNERSFKIIMWFFLFFILMMKIAIGNQIPNMFALLLVSAGLYLFMEIILKCFEFFNLRIGERLGFTKTFIIFLVLIIISF